MCGCVNKNRVDGGKVEMVEAFNSGWSFDEARLLRSFADAASVCLAAGSF